MKSHIGVEWMAFACGIVISAMIWSYIHERDSVQSTTAMAISVQEETPDKQAVKTSVPDEKTQASVESDRFVRVYLTDQHRIEKVPLEDYVRGVVAAEMPTDFEPAALEAQALAARTYIVRRLMQHDDSGVPVAEADVTDIITHQVYLSKDEMEKLRATDEDAWRKVDAAVNDTRGEIIAYKGQPIQALFFSTSNGYTENSEDVFPSKLPYLRSVASPWDRTGAPRSEESMEMPLRKFYAELGVRTLPVTVRTNGSPTIKITEMTAGNRVKTLSVWGKTFSGPDIRDKLKLRSTCFTWQINGAKIVITTYGSGHGVGMSQWGAQGMAKEGRTAEEIVKHYYTGVKLMEASKLAGWTKNG